MTTSEMRNGPKIYEPRAADQYGANNEQAANALQISVRRDNDTDVVVLAGEIDVATAPALRSTIHELLSTRRNHIIVDLDAVTFMDAAAIDALITGTCAAALSGGKLHVTRNPRFMLLLKLTCETHRVNVARSLR